MMLNKNEFEVLNVLARSSNISQRSIAQQTGLSLGTVNTTLKVLQYEGLIQNLTSKDSSHSDSKPSQPSITEQGLAALEPYKVDNAIILAAGLSTRFAPISYEKPKGLLQVRGEILIERQIKQLKEAGINDITIVAGYKKEQYFYLEDTLGVSFVINEEYAERNNHSSLMAVRDRLKNTYICSSDIYYEANPFNQYEWKAFYSAQYSKGITEEWCLTT